MILYLDTCCLNRPFDDRGNVQVYLERQAVLLIFEMAWQYPLDVRIVTSEFLDIEVNNIKDDARRDAIRGLMSIF